MFPSCVPPVAGPRGPAGGRGPGRTGPVRTHPCRLRARAHASTCGRSSVPVTRAQPQRLMGDWLHPSPSSRPWNCRSGPTCRTWAPAHPPPTFPPTLNTHKAVRAGCGRRRLSGAVTAQAGGASHSCRREGRGAQPLGTLVSKDQTRIGRSPGRAARVGTEGTVALHGAERAGTPGR